MTDKFHLGHLVRNELIRQGRSVTWLAQQINCERTNCYYIFERNIIDICLLEKISRALSHNFFTDLADYMTTVINVSTKPS
ncbi:MAG: hypothetical protein PUC50_11930 [Bacteroidales bacterium]|nr:hypothetical protein [Bacteroidales bacterium]